MEWFSRVDDGDVVVPKSFDGFSPSSDSWSQWDSTPFGNFKSEMKRNNIRSYVGAEDCKVIGNGVSSDVDMKNFGIHEEPFDNAANQASYCDMDQWSSYPPEQLEFHLDNFTSIDQLDDVFLSSLLNEDCPTGMDASDESSTDSRCSMLLDDDQVRDMTSNACAGTAKYFSAHAFTSPVDWEGQEVNNSYLLKKVMLLFILFLKGMNFHLTTPICEAGVESSTPEELKDFTASILCHLRALEGPADKLIGPVYYNEFQFIMMSYMKRFLAHLEF